MRISILTIGAVASIIAINSVFADTTVTSRGYVDAVVATKQAKIPAAGTNAATPGETVVTYTSTGDGTIGERGIFDGINYKEYKDSANLVTAFALQQFAECINTHTENQHSCIQYDENHECLLLAYYDSGYGTYPLQECYRRLFEPASAEGRVCRTNADCPSGQTCCPGYNLCGEACLM